MADLKDFGTVRSWYDAYKRVLGEKEEVPKGYHKMPDGKIMKDTEHKKDKDDKKKSPVEVLPKENGEKEEEKQPEGESVEKLKAEIERLKGEVQKKDLEVKKKDAETNVEPNPETGEVPLRVGIAQSILDKKKKGEKKEVKEETLDEKLKVSNGLGAWIDDFMKSDAPQFKGKSDKEKKNMAIAAFTDAGGKLEQKESLDESPVVDYARKLSSYAVKRGGIDRKDFMKIADRISKAKNDLDMKKIGKQVDDMDTEPRDLIKGSIALQMGPKTYKTMFGDRLTASDMNQYKKMTPRDMREESLDELREPFVVVDTAQGNKVVGMASDEKEAQSIISSAELPPMRIKNKKTLKVVKVRKKQMIGRPLQENLDEVNVDAKGTVPSKQIASLKRAYDSLPDRLDPEKAMALSKMLDRFGEGELRQLTHADIKFISTLAVNKLIMKHKYKAKDIHDIRKNKPKTVFD